LDSNLGAALADLKLVDHHVHGALAADLDRPQFEELITESDRPVPGWMTQFDSQLGFAIRRWCAPVLDLEPHASADSYWKRRHELGIGEVNRRFLRASGVGRFLIETGYRGELLLDLAGMKEVSGQEVQEVVRLEAVADELARSGVGAEEFGTRFQESLWARSENAVGLKSIAAYRCGLDFDPRPPTVAEVRSAAGRWLREVESGEESRVSDPVLIRHLIWTGVDRGLPLQFHVGYGDPDLDLHHCDPALLTTFIKLVEPRALPLMLLHCYPFHRSAGYLAQAFPHVYFDIGLAINYAGARADSVVAESLELAPFSKMLFSSDAWGPSELHYLGALLWRRATARVLQAWVESGEWSGADALRVASMVGAGNANRVYGLSGAG
jgi:predicted TIM-barrel fold metal-dependent hydrolase